ncbi:hypothetical protein V8J88_12275 [Massilia sp. W12]|uniref:hypothetical protein n=1 Tax=Massilia sp. W12 TaxID=3126507 RepID=UPI0030CFBB7C
METNAIFDKSDKGREEIVTRQHRLAPRLRSLLVLVDGRKNAAEILQQVAGLGLNQASLDELYEAGFIEPAAGASALPPPLPSPSLAPQAQHIAPPAPKPESAAPEGLIGAEQLLALQSFLSTTIKNTLGLRGFTLQLKAERAASLQDFRELRKTYIDAITKSKGKEMAQALADKFDVLLKQAAASIRV